MPYRVDLARAGDVEFDRLIELGALDAERSDAGGAAALMPDAVAPEQIAKALALDHVAIAPATGRDDDSVWVLHPRPIRFGRLRIVPATFDPERDALRLIDAPAFGTGLHATTGLCLDAIEELARVAPPDALLDVGTGSGVLALAALVLGVPRGLAIDVDDEALRVTAENARLNGLDERLQLAHGGPETVEGLWPLVVANVQAAPLIEMAPALVRRVSSRGQLILSGISVGVLEDVDQAYRRLGMRRTQMKSQGGWVAIVLQASW